MHCLCIKLEACVISFVYFFNTTFKEELFLYILLTFQERLFLGHFFIFVNVRVRWCQRMTETDEGKQDNLSENIRRSGDKTSVFLKSVLSLGCERMWDVFFFFLSFPPVFLKIMSHDQMTKQLSRLCLQIVKHGALALLPAGFSYYLLCTDMRQHPAKPGWESPLHPTGIAQKQGTSAWKSYPHGNEQFPSHCECHYHTLWYGLEVSVHTNTATYIYSHEPPCKYLSEFAITRSLCFIHYA